MLSEPDNSPASDHLDWDAALRGVGGDPVLLREIVQIFLEEIPNWLTQLQQALAARNTDQARRSAHTIKGAVSQLGMTTAMHLAQRLEICGRDGQFEEAVPLYKDLEHECEFVRPQQIRYLQSVDG